MHAELQRYLEAVPACGLATRADWQWRGDPTPLAIHCHATPVLPPSTVVSSVRTLVWRDDGVLVMRNSGGRLHVMPGGRREPGETFEQTVCREVLEEAGWQVRPERVLGCIHLQHEAPKPCDYPYPHPDFLWPIYLSQADRHVPDARLEDDYECESRFLAWDEASRLPLEPESRFFLELARPLVGS